MPKIILLTSPRVDCRWLAAHLCRTINLSMVVYEDKQVSFRHRMKQLKKRLGMVASLALPWHWGKLRLMLRLNQIDMRLRQEVLAQAPPIERPEFVQVGLPVPTRTFEGFNTPEAVAFLREQKPDLLLTYAISILRKPVIEIPPLGVINAHPALLPNYRGALAQFLQLYNEDYASTGVTVHYIDAGVDTGDIILQRAIPSAPTDTPPIVHFRNLTATIELFTEATKQVLAGTAQRTPQGKTDHPTMRRRDVTLEMKAKLYRRLGLM